MEVNSAWSVGGQSLLSEIGLLLAGYCHVCVHCNILHHLYDSYIIHLSGMEMM